MKINLIMDVVYLVTFALCVIIGDNVVESWWSFLFGAVVALSARDVLSELDRRTIHRRKLK